MDMSISRFTDARHLTIVFCTKLVGYRPKCRAGVDPGFSKREFLNGCWNGSPLSELIQEQSPGRQDATRSPSEDADLP